MSVKAQDPTNGSFRGLVIDESENPVRGATVVFTYETGVEFATQTNENGLFFRAALPPGTYTVKVALPPDFVDSITNHTLSATKLNAVLPNTILKKASTVAAVAQPAANPSTVVSAPTPIPALQSSGGSERLVLEGSQARRGEAFLEKELTGLPLGGTTLVRSFDELAFLAPGVAPPPQAIGNSVGPGVGPGVGTSGQFSVNGLRSRANNFMVDGSDNNDEDIGVRRQGFFTLIPQPIESVREFRIITLLAPAQFGRNLGAQINVLSKSGGKDFHGTAYGFFNSSQLNARNSFDYVGSNTETALLGRRLNGSFVNVEIQNSVNSAQYTRKNVANTAGGKDSLTFLQGGGTLGGPIVAGKMFFFVSAEGQLLNASKETHFAVPTVEERGFLRTGAEGLRLDTDFPFSLYPTSTSGDYIFSLFPFPNDPSGLFGRNTYTQVLPANASGRVLSGKIDYNFKIGGKQQIFTARYNNTDDQRDLQQVGGAIFSSIRPLTRTDNISTFLNGEVGNNVSNALRFSYGRTALEFEEIRDSTGFLLPVTTVNDPRFLLNAPALINQTLASDSVVNYARGGSFENLFGPVGQVILPGFSPIGVDVFNFPQTRVNDTFQIADTLFLQRGDHNLAFGADIRRTLLNSDLPRNSRPLITFAGALRGRDFNSSLNNPALDLGTYFSPTDLAAAGAPTGVFQSLVLPGENAEIDLRYNQYNLFAQDDYRVRRNFSISYGLRYELNTVPKETDGKIEDTFQAELPAPVRGLREFTGGRSQIYQSDKNNLAPRIGFAFAPTETTVVRGGYGVYYDQILGAVVSQSRNVFPTFTTVNFGAAGGSETTGIPFGIFNPLAPRAARIVRPGTLNTLNISQTELFALIAREGIPTPYGATLPNFELPTPLSHQYSIGIDQEIFNGEAVLSLAYVGTTGRNLLRFTTPNQGRNNIVTINTITGTDVTEFLGTNTAPIGRRVPNIGPIDRFETTGRSQYNSLQMQVRGRFNERFDYQLSYTLGKAMDDVSDVFDLAGAFALPQDGSFAGEYAPANFDVRHRLTYNFIYQLPGFNNQNGFVRYVLGNWQISGTGRYNTGQPFTVNTTLDINQDGNLTDRLDSTTFLNSTEDRRQPLRLITGNTASLLAPVGQAGSVPRNSFRSSDLLELDMSFNKSFSVTEGQNFNLRFDVFNFINRANYGIPIRFLEAPGFGQSVDTVTPGRRVQVALKYVF